MNLPEIEKKILKFWQDNGIFQKLIKKNQGKKHWSFLDGPITANNPMGVHHAWGRTYKDVIQRYKAMQGFDLRYQNGFDCQGLWVEVEVEKELGFKTKKDIENFGIEKFVELCKQRVEKYSKIQTEQSIRLGQWMDWNNSYYTMSDENNYAIWAFLKKCWEQGLLYKGKDVVPWCIRCGTAISQHEILTEEYKEITHKAIYVKLPVVGEENTYFLVWTTTPWTLPGNVALAVSPELEYAKIKDKNNDIFILLKDKAELISDGEILRTFKGKDLEERKYQGMFDEIEGVKNALGDYKHKVILWKDVTQEEGTGIVHIAPGCGQEDFKLGKELKLPMIDILDEESRYKKEFGFLDGKLATTVRDLIFEDLERKNIVFKIEDYTHRYPTCWRCKQELIFRLVDEWYISMEKIREKLKKTAKTIEWIPSFGLDRELDWLQNMGDWLISKKRYWGLTLPIFECEKCGNFEVIGSKQELQKRVAEGWEKFEGHSPHKPWLDAVKIKCSKCGEIVSRIKDVGNPWLDAGIVPFSTMGYFEDKKSWKTWFPADFICESFPGQFKNWFYAIIVMSAVLENKAPTKTIFGYASVRDENDEEMHKSKGNTIWFDEAVEKIGAETMRWMYVKQNPVLNLRFGWNAAEETRRKLMTLFNTFSFFHIYVKKEEFPEIKNALKTKNILDKWIISRFNSLLKRISENLDKYNFDKASIDIENFFIEDLSLWYLRRSRDRFHEKMERFTDKLICLDGKINWDNQDGIIVPAGLSKTIAVKSNISEKTAGQTVGIALNKVNNIEISKDLLTGCIMSIAMAPLASVVFNELATPYANYSLKTQKEYVMFQDHVTVSTRSTDLQSIRFKIEQNKLINLTNIKLYIDETQVGDTLFGVDNNGYITFDLKENPKRLDTGIRIFKLIGDIEGSLNGEFRVLIKNSIDIEIFDSLYRVKVLVSPEKKEISTGIQKIGGNYIEYLKKQNTRALKSDVFSLRGLEICLADNTPPFYIIVAGQATADLVCFTFKNTTQRDIKITNLEFERVGVSDDKTLPGIYLYEYENKNSRNQAIETFYYILLSLTKIISPILPFLSEEFYQALKTEKMPESVHLCEWPKVEKKIIDNDLEKTMSEAREVVAQVLAQRAEKEIRVRQPLSLLKIKQKFPEEILDIIKDEVNVKEIQTGEEFYLETELSSELLEEGIVREFVRQIQSVRKNKGLTPNDRISVFVSGENEIIGIILKNKDFIEKEVLADSLEEKELGGEVDKEVKIQENSVKISLQVSK